MADLKEIGKQAKAARYILAGLDTDTKNKALFTRLVSFDPASGKTAMYGYPIDCLQRQNVWKRTQQTFLQKMQRIWKPDAAAACRKGCLTGSP